MPRVTATARNCTSRRSMRSSKTTSRCWNCRSARRTRGRGDRPHDRRLGARRRVSANGCWRAAEHRLCRLKDRNDLGIHTEALNPGLVDLIRAGVVTNRRKAIDRGKTVFTFAMGQKAMYDFLNDNPAVESAPVDYVNDPHIIAQNDNVVSINATIEIDLTGACNSEHMLGHQYSASGGQLDFVRGAYASKGGKSIIAATSTAANGKISRIVPRLEGPVTTPRIDTHYIVTEFGAVNLKGLSSTERAHALIGLAHPGRRRCTRAEGPKRCPCTRAVRRRVILVRGHRTIAGGRTERHVRAKSPDHAARGGGLGRAGPGAAGRPNGSRRSLLLRHDRHGGRYASERVGAGLCGSAGAGCG